MTYTVTSSTTTTTAWRNGSQQLDMFIFKEVWYSQHLSMQGDGTAFIFQDRKDVFTLSMHAANNFPARKQKITLDVPLPDGMEDDDYLRWCRCLPCQLPASSWQTVLTVLIGSLRAWHLYRLLSWQVNVQHDVRNTCVIDQHW